MAFNSIEGCGGGDTHRYNYYMKQFDRSYHDTITLPKLIIAWREFLKGKSKRTDVLLFQARLMDNIYLLLQELESKLYVHGEYKKFNISDPKPRIIHKATVRDRLLHHLLYQELYPYFDKKFIFDSYSCRREKGTHKALYRFRNLARKLSCNYARPCWVLQCDIRKFFANIDHAILKKILASYISDKDILWLLDRVIGSFHTEGKQNIGLPLGNLTSQLLVNVYMNEFDQFVKRELKADHYLRYADDFIVLSADRNQLEGLLLELENFLYQKLCLSLHPDKVKIKTFSSGVDFLGWVQFPHHAVLRTTTKRRMFKNITATASPETIASYRGMLRHGNAYGLRLKIDSQIACG